ncbi:hypothetical protein HK097_004933, partial [Rhizophlyctis rosea]
MAGILRCDVDPDILAETHPMTWLQKESRRRIWFATNLEEMWNTTFHERPSTLTEMDYIELDPSRRPATKVKPFASETQWRSVRTLDGYPDPNFTEPTSGIDHGTFVNILSGVLIKCLSICGPISRL